MRNRFTTAVATLFIALTIFLPWPSNATADSIDSHIYVLSDDPQADGDDFPDLSHCALAHRVETLHPLKLAPTTIFACASARIIAAANAIRAPPGRHRHSATPG